MNKQKPIMVSINFMDGNKAKAIYLSSKPNKVTPIGMAHWKPKSKAIKDIRLSNE